MPVVGMVGGGQLARMTAAAAVGLGATFRVLAESANESAALVTHDVAVGSHLSLPDIAAFAADCDVITFDHEHVPGPILAELESAGVLVRPGSGALRYTQDKLAMRKRLVELGIPCPRFAPVASLSDVEAFVGGTWPDVPNAWPVVLKAVSGGYDGKGVWVCESTGEVEEVLAHGISLMAEEFVPFKRELAALVARSPSGQGAAYPVVQTVQEDGICREVIAPAPGLNEGMAVAAEAMALKIAAELGVTGLLAVELFETRSGALLVNELAMRPHNSGHWTIEGARTSQFEQHLRAVLDLPLGSCAPPEGTFTVMANLLGGTDPDVFDRYIHVMAADPAVKVHFYGKGVRAGRKIGHVTIVGGPDDEVEAVRDRARRAASYLRWGTEDGD
ncbi:MAG TPA: 5-(carboxyamino)imidazole ribonucleotide synthase [Trebonia sp.]|jgi:phosphoribosylaminoimidazole carboxylase PurK protein|nr:5-(carboxyamino)imidazole ribonucleotide synthase [Trebonia sp.]